MKADGDLSSRPSRLIVKHAPTREVAAAALAAAPARTRPRRCDPDSIGNWRHANRAPVGLAPDTAVTREGVVQVYAARAVRWRGYFGVHTWIAAKPANAPAFTVYEVTGFRVRRRRSPVTISQRDPDGRWFGSAPHLLADVRGPGVDPLVQRIEHAVAAYPYNDTYRIWPGPNSNTFTAFVLRHVPEL